MKNLFANSNPDVEFFFKKTSQTSIADATLLGTEKLRVKWVTTTFQSKYAKHDINGRVVKRFVSRDPVHEESKFQDFKLKEVSSEELLEIRKSGVAGFVLKIGDKLYYTELTSNINLFSVNVCGNHKCCCGQNMCKHLSAAIDEEGGCAKVRGHACGIEQYDFITKGCETFGTRHDMFVVVNCANYEECPPKKKVSPEKLHQMRLDLALFMWEDVDNLKQVQERKRKNHERNAREAAARNAKVKKTQAAKVAKSSKRELAAKTAK